MIDRMGGTWQGAVVPSTTPVLIPMNGAPLPCTVTLKSAAVGRLVEISTDGGTEYSTPTTTLTTATQMVLAVTYPISHVRVTGATNDTWSIR